MTILIFLAAVVNYGCLGIQASPESETDTKSRGYIESCLRAAAKTAQLQQDEDNGLLILVNKAYPLAADYEPYDLAPIGYFAPDRSAESRYMRAEAAVHFRAMVEAAKEKGLEIVMTTAYRSYNFQEILYNGYVAQKGEAAANLTSARPGQSEHQTGLAVDLSSPAIDYELSYEFGTIAEGRWLVENAYKYGFIIRYPKGKEAETGYSYEPWHIRYVGKTAAAEIFEQSISLEEYLAAREEGKALTGKSNSILHLR